MTSPCLPNEEANRAPIAFVVANPRQIATTAYSTREALGWPQAGDGATGQKKVDALIRRRGSEMETPRA